MVSRLVAQVILLISCLTCLTNCAGFVLDMGSLSCKKKMFIYIFFILKSKLIIVLFINFSWQEWRDSNPQPPVLETGALPIELHSYLVDCRTILQSKLFSLFKNNMFTNDWIIFFKLYSAWV